MLGLARRERPFEIVVAGEAGATAVGALYARVRPETRITIVGPQSAGVERQQGEARAKKERGAVAPVAGEVKRPGARVEEVRSVGAV